MSGDVRRCNVRNGVVLRIVEKEECTDTSCCGDRVKDRKKEDKRWHRKVGNVKAEDVNDTT
jgi:hypothetical protein